MKKIYFSIVILSFMAFAAVGCGEFVEPGKDNVLTREDVIANPVLAEGILLKAYDNLPTTLNYTAVAVDDAHSNNISNGYMLAATGAWRSTNDPFSQWRNYTQIAYINYFLERIVDDVTWSYSSEWRAEHFPNRLKGEAYALRAYHHSLILQAHAGKASSGELLGIPYMDRFVSSEQEQATVRRLPFAECVAKIEKDIERALQLLPDRYENAPAGTADKEDYDAVYGVRNTNRISGLAMKMLRARVRLLAASPAFNPTSDPALWEKAADAAAEVIDAFGGLENLAPDRVEFYLDKGNRDILWREDYTNSNNIEKAQFPPSLNGSGRVSPSQNFVDAFPMKSGWPIDSGDSGYDERNPYANRDPRLAKYVIYNGMTFKGTTINTVDHPSDGINRTEYSTCTGYYLKKFANEAVSLETGNVVSAIHFNTLMRFTEAFLIYAEAANEAWGPDASGSHAYSARDVMARLRETAGIDQPDTYLASISTPEEMRKLIRNERRLELCFEQIRFWDVRRWLDYDVMNATVRGTFDGGLTSVDVKERSFERYMIYGPIPNDDVVKGLIQNEGWI